MLTLTRRVKTCLTAVGWGLAVGWSACAPAAPLKEDLLVGCEGAFAPFTYVDEQGQLTGFDVDLIRALGTALGYNVKITVYPFDGLIPALLTDNIDLIISGFSISEERAKRVDFSDPYYLCGLTYLINKADLPQFDRFEKLGRETLCLQIGTTGAMFVQKHLPGATLKQFNSPPETYLELQNHGCRAVVNDRPVNDFFLAKHKITDIAAVDITSDDKEYYGIAVNKGNQAMLREVNRGLKLVIANGEFARISRAWFGYDILDTLQKSL